MNKEILKIKYKVFKDSLKCVPIEPKLISFFVIVFILLLLSSILGDKRIDNPKIYLCITILLCFAIYIFTHFIYVFASGNKHLYRIISEIEEYKEYLEKEKRDNKVYYKKLQNIYKEKNI